MAFTRRTRWISNALKRATQIELTNIPRTATPADLRRLVARAQVQGVEDAAVEYHRFEPTGRAYLKLTHSDYLLPSLDALEKVSISGVHPVAEPSLRHTSINPTDTVDGDGLSSELHSNGNDVVVWGLPKTVGEEVMNTLLDGFSFPPGKPYIFKLPTPHGFSTVSRFLVRFDSISEAHRLVRQLHMTQFKPAVHGTKYPIRARVIY